MTIDSKKSSKDPKESPLGKVKIELPNASSSCPFHNWFYIGVAFFALSYAVYLQDRQDLLCNIHTKTASTAFGHEI